MPVRDDVDVQLRESRQLHLVLVVILSHREGLFKLVVAEIVRDENVGATPPRRHNVLEIPKGGFGLLTEGDVGDLCGFSLQF